jgi:hypothetical protein
MTTETNPLSLDRFTVHIDNARSGQFVIADRDLTPVNGATAEAVLGDRDPAVIWYTSDRYGYIVFPMADEGERLADLLCSQLNAADAENDAAALINSAASLAERIEAEAADGLTAEQRRGLAAYQRALVVPPYPYSAACGRQYRLGERVQIGTVGDRYEYGVYSALVSTVSVFGELATVVLPHRPGCPLIVITDDDDILALPSPGLYVHPVTE